MSRNKGTLSFSGNFEPDVASPFDARAVVGLKSDLILASTWTSLTGGDYTYAGMLTVVSGDTADNNGIWILNALPATDINNWKHVGSAEDAGAYDKDTIDALLAQKVTIVSGKDLSTNDFTDEYKAELDAIDTTINDAITTAIAGKADSDDVYTKTEIDSKISSVFVYKGNVNDIASLPSDGNVIGDTYNVTETGSNYTWNGTEWDKLSETLDLSGFALSTDVTASLALKVDKEEGKALSANDFTDAYKAELDGLDDTIADAIADKADADSVYTTLEADAKFAVASEVTDSLALKVDAVSGKGLSTNDFTNTYKNSLDNLDSTITTAIEGKADSDDVYTKTESDAKYQPVGSYATTTALSEGLALKVNAEDGKGLSANDFTDAYKAELDGLDTTISSAITTAIADKADSDDVYTKTEVDTELADKVDVVSGKGLSTNDFTDDYKADLDGLDTTISSAITTAIASKANSADVYTKSEVYTQTEVDSLIGSVFTFKGSVDTVADLPSTDNKTGDTYNVNADGSNYTWDGSAWDKLSETLDLSIYAESATVNTALAGKVNVESGKGLSTNDFTDAYKAELDGLDTTISTAIAGKVDSEAGKGLSANDFTDDYKADLDGLDTTISTAISGKADSSSVYTKTEIDSEITDIETAIDTKQDTLAVGDNITIDSDTNEISAVLETYTNSEPSVITVGGIAANTTFDGMTMTELFDMLLYPELEGTLTPPSATFTENAATYIEVGVPTSITFTSTFKRGSINPQYESESAYRSGLPTQYVYDGDGLAETVTSTALTDTKTITYTFESPSTTTWGMTVSYSAGVQPKTNKGNDYDEPLAAGSITRKTATAYGVYAHYATTSDIETMTKQTLQAITNNTYTIGMVAEDDTNKQTFDIHSSAGDLLGVKMKNLQGTYEYIKGSAGASLDTFTKTSVTYGDVEYDRYVNNQSKTGARSLQFLMS